MRSASIAYKPGTDQLPRETKLCILRTGLDTTSQGQPCKSYLPSLQEASANRPFEISIIQSSVEHILQEQEALHILQQHAGQCSEKAPAAAEQIVVRHIQSLEVR